jgi:hypothetical protein
LRPDAGYRSLIAVAAVTASKMISNTVDGLCILDLTEYSTPNRSYATGRWTYASPSKTDRAQSRTAGPVVQVLVGVVYASKQQLLSKNDDLQR